LLLLMSSLDLESSIGLVFLNAFCGFLIGSSSKESWSLFSLEGTDYRLGAVVIPIGLPAG